MIRDFDQLFDATAPDFTPYYAELRGRSPTPPRCCRGIASIPAVPGAATPQSRTFIARPGGASSGRSCET